MPAFGAGAPGGVSGRLESSIVDCTEHTGGQSKERAFCFLQGYVERARIGWRFGVEIGSAAIDDTEE